MPFETLVARLILVPFGSESVEIGEWLDPGRCEYRLYRFPDMGSYSLICEILRSEHLPNG